MLQALLLAALRGYKRFISPMLGQRCRFYPSCSVYAMGAIRDFGALRGSVAAGARLCRCQPLCDGGLDPVPEHFADCFWWGQNPNPQTPATDDSSPEAPPHQT
ncbi:membrane protein insertion efficiency factor YidD [Ahniella affigens]|uniref:Putative membrane protein insertion efficiency factor n=1 Tax=Ahniella affigens TaxID=2021234 RepID=A0A2P1PTB3_9GAMM|nr:membrane protein insertion efficiency factor YidD [Ahniella affigens]AVP98084.1 membrane protein insertion efficiency factor YidD [Ahniella affigens]